MRKRVVRKESQTLTDARGLRTLRAMMKEEQGDLFEGGPAERVVIGLDGSLTKYGICVLGLETDRFTAFRYTPKYKGARRLFEVYEMIQVLIMFVNRNYDLAEITMEGYSFGSKGSQAHKIGEGGAATKLALVTLLGGDDRLAYPTLVSPNAVKKFATGKGSGDKNIILMRVFKKWGVEFSDDNMADSFVLAKIAAAVVCDETDHEYESEVVASLERSTEWEPLT